MFRKLKGVMCFCWGTVEQGEYYGQDNLAKVREPTQGWGRLNRSNFLPHEDGVGNCETDDSDRYQCDDVGQDHKEALIQGQRSWGKDNRRRFKEALLRIAAQLFPGEEKNQGWVRD